MCPGWTLGCREKFAKTSTDRARQVELVGSGCSASRGGLWRERAAASGTLPLPLRAALGFREHFKKVVPKEGAEGDEQVQP